MNISFNHREHDGAIVAEISSCVTRIVEVIDAWSVDGEANDAVSIAWKQSPEDNRRELFDMINPFDHKHFVEQA